MNLNILFFLLFLYSSIFSQTHITVLHTNNLNGTLENCICPDHPFGSVEKIKPLLDKIRKQEKNVLLFDAGDMLSPFADKNKDITMLEVLPLLKYDAITVGDQDFLHGMNFFTNNFIKNKFPIISANIDIKSAPYVIKKISGIRVGVIGVTSSKAFNFFPEENRGEIKVHDIYKNIDKYLDEIKNKADIIILLSHSGLDEDKKTAKIFPQIDLIVGGHSQNALKEGVKVGKTLIVQAGSDGYFLGRVDMSLDKNKKISYISSQLIPIGIELKNDKQIVAIIKKYDFGFIQKAVEKQKLIKPITGSFLTVAPENCGECHKKEFSAWKKSAHARSWQSLKNKKKTKSLKCISCHVSGFGKKDGFINVNITSDMKNVSCTDCHYTQTDHLRKKNKKTVKTISEKTCIRCHDNENDADFDYKKALSRIKH